MGCVFGGCVYREKINFEAKGVDLRRRRKFNFNILSTLRIFCVEKMAEFQKENPAENECIVKMLEQTMSFVYAISK